MGLVKSSFVFQTCLEHVRFVQKGDTLNLLMTNANWNLVDELETHDVGLPSMMRQMLRKQRTLQTSLDSLQPHCDFRLDAHALSLAEIHDETV